MMYVYRSSRDGFAWVYQVAKLLARLEVRHAFGRYGNGSSGFRVAARARLALAGTEAAETTDFHFVIGFKGADDGIEKGVDNDFAIAAGKVAEGCNVIDEFSFRHRRSAPVFRCTAGTVRSTSVGSSYVTV
jgi:hypothetical protein